MKSKQDRKLETLGMLIIEVYEPDSKLIYRKEVEFKGYYATGQHAQHPDGYFLGADLDDALDNVARTAAELMRQERQRRELFNATHQIKR